MKRVESIAASALAVCSVRELALRAVVALLGAAGSPAISVTRSQLDAISADSDLPCFDVAPGAEKLEADEKGKIKHTLQLEIRAIADATGSDDSLLDPMYIWALHQLTGEWSNLAGMVDDVELLECSTVFKPAGHNLIALEMKFEVTFATKRGDPTQRG